MITAEQKFHERFIAPIAKQIYDNIKNIETEERNNASN